MWEKYSLLTSSLMRGFRGRYLGRISKEDFCGEKILTFYTSAPSKREVSSFFLTPVKSNSRQGEHSENLSFISSVRKELSEVASDSCLETLRCKRQVGCSSGKGRDVAAVFAVFPEGKMKEGSP